MHAQVLVIGYGNSLRRDDGAGLILAAALVEAWSAQGLPAALITDHQLNPELAGDIAESGCDAVVFVDAVAGGPDAGIEIIALGATGSDAASPSLGHHLSPPTVMLYARELFGYRGDGWVITVPGYDFEHGEGLSARTRKLVEGCVREAAAVWEMLLDADQH